MVSDGQGRGPRLPQEGESGLPVLRDHSLHRALPAGTGRISHPVTVGAWWERLAPLPGGKRLFSWLLWRLVPYTRSVRPHVLEPPPRYGQGPNGHRRPGRKHRPSLHPLSLPYLARVAKGLPGALGRP